MKGERSLGAGKPRKPRALTSILISLLVAVAVAMPMALRVADSEPQSERTTTTTEVEVQAPAETLSPSVLPATEERDPGPPGG